MLTLQERIDRIIKRREVHIEGAFTLLGRDVDYFRLVEIEFPSLLQDCKAELAESQFNLDAELTRVGMLSAGWKETIRQQRELEAKVEAQAQAIMRAPHGAMCAALQYDDYNCNCWKKDALSSRTPDAKPKS